MKIYLGVFKKTTHFMYRQWDRTIDDRLLEPILKKIEPTTGETLYIVSLSTLKKINKSKQKELFIKIKGKILITCFYCKFQDYKSDKTNQKYRII